MDEIKIWSIGGSEITEVQPTNQAESEQWLEDNLVGKPDLLIPGLTLVGRQTQTEGGPLDLLGVDSDGRLAVFELKRGTLSRDAVAQVIDYTSYLDLLSESALFEHISSQSGAHGIENIDDFGEWYLDQFEEVGSLKPIRMFLVGLGADRTTARMVDFIARNSGMDISLLTFHGFTHEGKTLLARQVHVEGILEAGNHTTRRRSSRAERQADFNRRVEDFGVRQLIEEVRDLFKTNWPKSRERIGAYGLRIQLPEAHNRQYARVNAWSQGVVGLIFFPQAKALCLEAFEKLVREIPYQTYPRDRHPIRDSRSEIQFKLTAEVWERNKEELASLVQAVYAAWVGGLNEQ